MTRHTNQIDWEKEKVVLDDWNVGQFRVLSDWLTDWLTGSHLMTIAFAWPLTVKLWPVITTSRVCSVRSVEWEETNYKWYLSGNLSEGETAVIVY